MGQPGARSGGVRRSGAMTGRAGRLPDAREAAAILSGSHLLWPDRSPTQIAVRFFATRLSLLGVPYSEQDMTAWEERLVMTRKGPKVLVEVTRKPQRKPCSAP